MTVTTTHRHPATGGTLSETSIERIAVTFDEPNLVANAGLVLVATVVGRLGLEGLAIATIDLSGRVGGFKPGQKTLTIVHAMVALASHIDHADMAPCRLHGQSARTSRDGAVDPWDLFAFLHLRPRPPLRKADWRALRA